MTKVKIGDVVEIKTSRGFSYAQYAHKHKQYGALLRVYNKVYPAPLVNFEDLVGSEPAFSCFFPLKAAVDKGAVSIVKNCPLSVSAQKFPIFRTGVVNPETRKVDNWWLWDGEREWKVGKLTDQQRKLSVRGVWNDTILVERIESGWTPETDAT